MSQPAQAELTQPGVAGRRLSRSLRGLAGICALSLLAACASHAPRLSSTQQAAQYKDNAAADYTPPGPASDPWGPYVVEASRRFDVPQSWIRNVMHTESGGHLYVNGQLVTSGVGAMGLMQVMPQTYQELSAQYSLGDDPYAPHDNIMAGTAYLREMYDLFGSPGFLAAYNAGPQRLNQYLTDGRPLPAETTHYVAMIAPYIHGDMPGGQSPADRFAMNSMNAPSGRAYNGGAYSSPASLANTGGGAVSSNMLVAINQARVAPTFAPTAESGSSADDLNAQQASAHSSSSGLSADDLNSRQVAVHGAALAASGGGAVPADLMVASNDPRPSQAEIDQQEAAADVASINSPQAAPVQAPVYQAPIAQAPVYQAPVYQAPVRMAVNLPAPPPAPVYVPQPAYRPAVAPAAAPRIVAYQPALPAPPPPAPRMQLAAFATPTRRTAPVNRVVGPYGTQNLAMEMNDPPTSATPRRSSFRLIAPAMADTMPLTSANDRVGGGWAIQVGAYGSAGDARDAVATARQHGHMQLASARSLVMPVHVSQKVLYRARLGGLSEHAAVNACSTLSHSRTPCMVLSPDAQ
jgi:hypothetical protein